MSGNFLKQFYYGLTAPFYSARFLLQKKSLFLIAILPHILNFILYAYFVQKIIIQKWLTPFLSSAADRTQSTILQYLYHSQLIGSFIWLMAILFYSVIGLSFVNAVASPIYDYIAQKTYENFSNHKLPSQTMGAFIDSLISEFTKAIIVLCVFIISLFLHIFAPILFLLSIWYLGWNSVDRTLLLTNLPLKERIKFGLKNSGLCIGLGLWSYFPIIGPLAAFTIASAGGLLVAKTNIPYFDGNTTHGENK